MKQQTFRETVDASKKEDDMRIWLAGVITGVIVTCCIILIGMAVSL